MPTDPMVDGGDDWKLVCTLIKRVAHDLPRSDDTLKGQLGEPPSKVGG